MKKLLLLGALALSTTSMFAQWTEDFDASGTMPEGWAVINQGDDNGFLFGSAVGGAHSGDNVAKLYYDANIAHDDYLITKAIEVQNGVADRISFYVRSRSATYLENYKVLLSTTNQTAEAFTVVLQDTQEAPGVWTKLTFDLSAYNGQTVYVAIHATDTDKYELYADTFVVDRKPACEGETITLTSSNIELNSVDLSWNAGTVIAEGYTIYYSTENVAPTADTTLDATNSVTVDGSTTSTTLTGLQDSSTYYIWGRKNCNSEGGNWSTAPIMIQTKCTPAVSGYTQDFATFLPICWEQAKGGAPETGSTETGQSSWGSGGFLNEGTEGAAKINIYGNEQVNWLISPVFDLSSGGSYVVSFDYGLTKFANTEVDNLGSDDKILVLLSSDNGATWSVAKTWGASNTPLNVSQTAYISLDAHASATTKIAFYTTSGAVDNGTDVNFYVDNFKVIPTPACIYPTNAMVSNVGTTTANVSWDASTTTVGEGYTVYYTTEQTMPAEDLALDATNSITVAGTETSAMLTGLQSGMVYYAWIKASCSTTESSTWELVGNFKTECAAYMPGYTQDFSEFLPTCWFEAKGGDPATGYTNVEDSKWEAANFLNNGTDSATRIKLYDNERKEWLISPTFDLSASGSYMVAFDYAFAKSFGGITTMGSDDKIMVLASSDDGTTWTVIHTWDASTTLSGTRQPIYLDLTPYASATTRVAIYATDGTTDDLESYYFYVDNFKVIPTPSCIEPLGVTNTNVAGSTVDISWSASMSTVTEGYAVYYSTEDVAPTADTVLDATNSVTVAPTATTVTLTGLEMSTDYHVWVRANCSATDSSDWSLPTSFTTNCDGAYMVDYAQDFEEDSLKCWFEAKGGDPTAGYTSVANAAWIAKGFLNKEPKGAMKINLYAVSRKDWLVSPTLDLPAGENYVLSFDYGVTKYNSTILSSPMGSDDKVVVLISQDNGTTWEELHTWDASNAPTNTRNHFVLDISTYASETTRIAIYATDGSVDDAEDYDFFIDNFKVAAQADCPEPMGVELLSIAGSGAVVSWTAITETSSATAPEGYTVYYSTENVAPSATTTLDNTNSVTVAGTETSAEISGLQPKTTYYTWVRANCSATSSSSWSFSSTFKTVCLSKTPEYVEAFSSFPPECWSQAQKGDPVMGYDKFGSSTWEADGFLNDGNVGSARVNMIGKDKKDWLISPIFDLSDATNLYTLSFDYGVTDAYSTAVSAMGSDDKIVVIISNDNGITWQEVQVWDVSNTPSNTLNTFTLDITNYASATTKVAFYATNGTVDDSGVDYNFYVDNFKIESSPNTTGTIEQELTSLDVYPNPATDVINISNDKVIDTVEVYDINGRRIINQNVGDVRTSVQVNHLATGTYFVKVSSEGKTATKQVIVK